jgi:hypothetical protein
MVRRRHLGRRGARAGVPGGSSGVGGRRAAGVGGRSEWRLVPRRRRRGPFRGAEAGRGAPAGRRLPPGRQRGGPAGYARAARLTTKGISSGAGGGARVRELRPSADEPLRVGRTGGGARHMAQPQRAHTEGRQPQRPTAATVARARSARPAAHTPPRRAARTRPSPRAPRPARPAPPAARPPPATQRRTPGRRRRAARPPRPRTSAAPRTRARPPEPKRPARPPPMRGFV